MPGRRSQRGAGIRAANRAPGGLLDKAAIATMPIPVVGDAVGLLSDAAAFAQEPSVGNAAMGLLGAAPFIPSGAALRSAGRVLPNTGAADNVAKSIDAKIAKRSFDEPGGFGDEVVLRKGDTDLQMSVREDDNGIYLLHIAAKKKGDLGKRVSGSGVGSEAVMALKDYADKTGKPLAVVGSTRPAQSFWRRFDFLNEQPVEMFMGDDVGFIGRGETSFVYNPK